MYSKLSILSLSVMLISATIFDGKIYAKTTTSSFISYVNRADTAGNLAEESVYYLSDINSILERQVAARLMLGTTREGRDIEAWYFPGISEQRALIIGGMHGSELSSIEVANSLLHKLILGERPFYSVIVIPQLFPDNAALAMNQPEQMGSVMNIGRYTTKGAVDPNRQMPSPGKGLNEEIGVDHLGRAIEWENRFLLQLMQRFRPSRIANLHAIRNTEYGGIYADPRTNAKGIALGYDSDSSLAIDMASYVEQLGGNVAGNHLAYQPNALYYKDPIPVAAGNIQRRNMTGSMLGAHRGSGVSLGTWGTTAVDDHTNPTLNRDAMRVLTLEFPGSRRPADYSSAAMQEKCKTQVIAFTESLYHIFLGNYHSESSNQIVIRRKEPYLNSKN